MVHSQYKAAANEALAHVKTKVKYRGLNTVPGWIRSPADIPQKFYARIKSAIIGNERSDQYKGQFDSAVYIPELAKLGIESGTGNCSELSAVAFMYLVKKRVVPLEYFGVFRGSWNHAFVVVNRKDVPVKNFADWSYSAIVIDPLYDRVGDAGFLSTWYPKMFPMQEKDLVVRLDS